MTIKRIKFVTEIWKENFTESGSYPVHFQQDTGFSLRISKIGVRETRAETQEAPLEDASFLIHVIGAVLHKMLSSGAIHIIVLL